MKAKPEAYEPEQCDHEASDNPFSERGPDSALLRRAPFEQLRLYLTGFVTEQRETLRAIRLGLLLRGSSGEIDVVVYDHAQGVPAALRGVRTIRVPVSPDQDQELPLSIDVEFGAPVRLESELFYIGFVLRDGARIDTDRRFPFIGYRSEPLEAALRDGCSVGELEEQLRAPQARPLIAPRFQDDRYDGPERN